MRIGLMLRAFEEKGGVGVYTRNIARHLVEAAPEHEYFLYFGRPEDVGTFSNSPNVTERHVPLGNKAVWDQLKMPLWFRRDQLDVLFHPKFTVPLLCARRSAMVLHGAGWFIPETKQYWSLATRLYARVMMPLYCRLAGAVLSVSEITRQEFHRRLGVAESKITTVYFAPGAEFSKPAEPEEAARIRQQYRLAGRYILTLTGGDRAERKNFDAILQAFRKVHENTPCQLVVAGRGCENFRERFGIPDTGYGADIVFTGWVEQSELPALFRSATMFLYPSNMEAFPIPITESLACGTPIVTSNAFGLRELAGDAALLVDPSDPDGIAAAVQRILDDDGLRADLGTRARLRSERFSWERCTTETLRLLERIGSE
jgi:glycosyltransferase involved in cell wall biosynthesis